MPRGLIEDRVYLHSKVPAFHTNETFKDIDLFGISFTYLAYDIIFGTCDLNGGTSSLGTDERFQASGLFGNSYAYLAST